MRIALQEIWNFLDLIDPEEHGWTFTLEAGHYRVEAIESSTLKALKADDGFDTEILPSLFTFREILWQPDVFTEAKMSLAPLRVLKAFCDETCAQFQDENAVHRLYADLLGGMASCCEQAEAAISENPKHVTDILGKFRTCTFPIIKFFIYHPRNRTDYYRDAVNRLNYAVKIMLTQFYGQYTELAEPYWMVNYADKKPTSKEQSSGTE